MLICDSKAVFIIGILYCVLSLFHFWSFFMCISVFKTLFSQYSVLENHYLCMRDNEPPESLIMHGDILFYGQINTVNYIFRNNVLE